MTEHATSLTELAAEMQASVVEGSGRIGAELYLAASRRFALACVHQMANELDETTVKKLLCVFAAVKAYEQSRGEPLSLYAVGGLLTGLSADAVQDSSNSIFELADELAKECSQCLH